MTMRTNKEILAVVNQMVSDGQVSQDVAEKYFPELRENKDERMMKIIMNALIKVPSSELDGLIPDTIRIWLEGKIKQGEKKPVDKAERKPTECSEWSEEDKVMLDEIIDFFENGTVKLQHDLSLYASWLKSLRPQKNNWRRVTKEIYFKKPVLIRRKDRTDSWEGYVVCNDYTLRPQTDECYIRIKDINNQKQWKPSKKQMEALLSEVEAWTKGCPKQVILESLYNDLKKLREG